MAQVAHASQPLVDLAAEPTWIRLGHYEPDSSVSSGWQSAIHSSDFFLHADGRINPRLELEATLAAFAIPPANENEQHAQCRFPARWHWLRSKIGAHAAFAMPVKCNAFNAWTRSGNIESLSVVLASGYLGNPASYYGHTLLKFNFKGDQGQTRLMDISVNYGAIVEKNDGPFTYIAKSLSGGYDGGFSHIQFYFHNHNYGNIELRDLWEYKIDLPANEVDLIVAHAWEVLGKRYTYRFFRYNCAYRMAELLQIVDGVKIIPEHTPWVIPQALIQQISSAKFRDKPLLADTIYYPSRQSRFYEKYRALSAFEAEQLENLIHKKYGFKGPAYRALPARSKQALLDTLIDYYQFVGNPLDKAPRELRQDYVDALSARFDVDTIALGQAEIKPAPHIGRPPGWIQTGWGHNDRTGNFLSIKVRPAYYDSLDADSGHVRDSALVMSEFHLRIAGRKLRLHKFELFGVDSANPGLSRLPGDNSAAMKMHIGVEPLRLSCDNCPVARVQGDIGLGRQWTGMLFGAVYIGGALQGRRANEGIGFGRTSADLILNTGATFRAKLGYQRRFPVRAEERSYGVTSLEARWMIRPRADFRIQYDHDRATSINLGFGMYW